MKLLEGDEVIGTYVAYDGDEILLASRNGFVTRYPISLIPITSPRSKGVKAMNLVNDDIASAIVHREAGNQLVVFSDTLAMKRLKLSEIDITGRPVKGNMICKKVKSKPYQIAYIGIYDIKVLDIPVSLMCDRAILAAKSVKGIYMKYYAYYDNSMRNVLLEEQELINGIDKSLENGEFEIYFQPKCNMNTNKITGAEVLVRWNHPTKRNVNFPERFYSCL